MNGYWNVQQPGDVNDAEVDEETGRNTSYNVTPVCTSISHSTSTTASGTTSDPAAVSQCPITSTNDQSMTSPGPEMSRER